ncbi:RNA polymerase sigma factor [Actinomadura chibensis]|uniref:Sigma-70 family RNA polymerase sigma factor n=1 Tax=Actinomadura chibensis TaxID=392828 RepID=A0A5D0NAI3_9ACTN|nr:sigma-70 family RNA polymerase sigma factor [Actinomadura chibensis]TYB41339.1 sigma-70 family RNA polymerase sigma factor [Actinomadura chibensis]
MTAEPGVEPGAARDAERAVAEAFRAERGQVVATLIRMTGDWDLAEECAQDAFAAALERWPRDGVPSRPGAWLTTTARNRARDRLRRDATGARRLAEAAADRARHPHQGGSEGEGGGVFGDDRLRLVFTCCHPALNLDARVALTLRVLGGLGTAEIARAFLVDDAAMSKRITRAKRKIRDAGIPYRVPPPHLLPERTAGVLGVLYLLFNEGYAATAGDALQRRALSAEAIRLARLVAALPPADPEARGLLALMLLHDARAAARTGPDGVLVPLEEQDRSRWDAARIAEGVEILEDALRPAPGRPPAGPYRIQAAIAACHATAATADATDWPQIAALYERLIPLVPSPVVRLNHAVAVAMARGPAAGLPLLDDLDRTGALDGYHLLPAARADLLRRLGRRAGAARAYRRALDLARNDADRRYLTRRLDQVTRPQNEPPAGVRPGASRSSVG